MLCYIVNVFDGGTQDIVKSFEALTADDATAIESKYAAAGWKVQLAPRPLAYLDKFSPPAMLRPRRSDLPEYLRKLL